MSKHPQDKYQVTEQNGKQGVIYLDRTTGDPIVVLQPIYASVAITEHYKPLSESIIQEYESDESVYRFGEYNCQSILADGKHSLLFNGKLMLPLEYERIIKLSFCHYLCQRNVTWELYHHFGVDFELQATLNISDELTLSDLLDHLVKINAYLPKDTRDTAALAKRLYQDPNADHVRYISEYRHYSGFQRFPDSSDIHDFVIYTERVILHNDFSMTLFDRVYPK